MTKEPHSEGLERLIDANLNRIKEGIRVIEDISRYIHDDSTLTPQLKTLRHQLQQAYQRERLVHRDIEHDIQKKPSQVNLTAVHSTISS